MTKKAKGRARYSSEFKQQALRALNQRGESTSAQAAESLGVSEYLLHSWRARERVQSAPSDRGETPEEELRRLRRENAELRKDRDALAKSISVFVRDRK